MSASNATQGYFAIIASRTRAAAVGRQRHADEMRTTVFWKIDTRGGARLTGRLGVSGGAQPAIVAPKQMASSNWPRIVFLAPVICNAER